MVQAGNRFLENLVVRGFSPATVRAYAFDVANFADFLQDRLLRLEGVASQRPSSRSLQEPVEVGDRGDGDDHVSSLTYGRD